MIIFMILSLPTTTVSVVIRSVVVFAISVVVGIGVVSKTVVVQLVSSSGQSSIPSHQDVSLIQILLVGQSLVPSGQGLHTHEHSSVTTDCKPGVLHGSHFFSRHEDVPPRVQIHCWQFSVS